MLDSADAPDYVNPEGTILERPDDPMYYRNYYTQDAPSYLRDLIEKIRSLEMIPVAGHSSRWRDFVLDVSDAEVKSNSHVEVCNWLISAVASSYQKDSYRAIWLA